MSLLKLYLLFFKIGLILIGGGYVVLPILKQELVKNRNLLSEDELVDYYAISQSLPGLIAINVSLFIGYKLKNKLGALVSVLGMITAPYFIIVLLATILAKVVESSLAKSILYGVEFGVIILIFSSFIEMWGKSIKNVYFFLLFCFYLALILRFNINPVIVIILSILIGLIFKSKIGEK